MKVLVLSRWFPYPQDNGSKIRIWNVISELSRCHQITLVSFDERQAGRSLEARAALATCCSTVETVPYHGFRASSPAALRGLVGHQPRALVADYSRAMSVAVARQLALQRPDLVVATELAMVPYALEVTGVPRVVDDLELSVFEDATNQGRSRTRRLRASLTWFKLTRYLRQVLPRFDLCTVVSDAEQARVRRAAPGYDRVEVVPNAVDLTVYEQQLATIPQPNTLVFSGALSYHANYDAIRYFLAAIYPSVIHDVPDSILQVTGRTADVDLGALPSGPGVHFTGHVEDIRPVIAGSWASVAPLRIGGGTRLKILESMALGTPVVATSKGAEGLTVTHGRDILLADQPEVFAAHLLMLLGSPELRARLSGEGRRLVETTYNWCRVGELLRRLVDNVGQPAVLLLLLLALASSWGVPDARAQESWSQPVTLFTDDGHVSDPLVIADPSGDVHLFFRWSERYADTSLAPAVLMYAHRHDGRWTSPVDVLTSPNGENLSHPALALDDGGFMHAIWSGVPSGQVYYSRAHVAEMVSPNAWSAPQPLSESLAVSSAFGSPVAIAAVDGLLNMVYAGQDGTIRSRRSSNGGATWSPAVTVVVTAGTDSAPDQVRIAAEPGGRVHVAWTQLRLPEVWPPTGVFYSQSLDQGDTWSLPSRIAGGDYGLPNFAVARSGVIHRIWHGTAGGSGVREHQLSADGGRTWSTPQLFTTLRGGFTGYSPMAFDGAGRLHIVTSVTGRRARGTEEIFHMSWDGATWTPPTVLSAGATGKQSVEEPSLAISSGNLLHVVFEDDFQRLWYTTLLLELPGTPAVDVPPPPVRTPIARGSAALQAAQALPTASPTPRVTVTAPAVPTGGQPFGPLVFATLVALVLVGAAGCAYLWRREPR